MRAIKFGGKCAISGNWVEGDLIHGVGAKSGVVYILPRKVNLAGIPHCHPLDGVVINPDTLCEFTGVTDKNGKEVWEGDYDEDGNVVVWCDTCMGYEFGQLDAPTREIVIPCHRCDGDFFFQDYIGDFEVIGNIHEKTPQQ